MKIVASTPTERCFLQDFCLDAILAGGAVRDTTLGKPVRDYDFYMEDGPKVEELRSLGFRVIRKGTRKYDDPNIVEVQSSGSFDVIIVKGSPVEHINTRFCTDFCKAYGYFDADGEVHSITTHAGFDKAVEDKVIKISMGAHLNPHLLTTYLPKLHAKYPEYRMELAWPDQAIAPWL
jgi:hypothetical protein